jgi:hypothetical protein
MIENFDLAAMILALALNYLAGFAGALGGFYFYHRAVKSKFRINIENWQRQTEFNDLLLNCARENEKNIEELRNKYNHHGVTLDCFQDQMNEIKVENDRAKKFYDQDILEFCKNTSGDFVTITAAKAPILNKAKLKKRGRPRKAQG